MHQGLKVVTENNGTILVLDNDECTWGVGATLSEAEHDFWESVREWITVLRADSPRLHPRLLDRLHHLEHDFPQA